MVPVMWIGFSTRIRLKPVERPFLSFCWKVLVFATRWFLIVVLLMFMVQTIS